MRLKPGAMTGSERAFVERFAATGDATYAAEKAGYVQPRTAALRLAKNERLQPAIRSERMKNLARIADKGLKHFEDTLDDPKASIREKNEIVRTTLAELRKLEAEEAGQDLEPHELSGEELRRRSEEAKVIVTEYRRSLNAQPAPNLFD